MRENMTAIAALLNGMDAVVEGNGRTLLDNSLVVVMSDMATSTTGQHTGADAPILLAGSLGGKFRTGEVIDYGDRRADPMAIKVFRIGDNQGPKTTYYAGPPTNALMISIMQSFGLTASDWEDGQPGFGFYTRRQSPSDSLQRIANGEVVGDRQQLYWDYLDDRYLPSHSPGSALPYLTIG
jgi:hypothetical protein